MKTELQAKVEHVLALNEARRGVNALMYNLLYDALNDADSINVLNTVNQYMKDVINGQLADDMRAAGLTTDPLRGVIPRNHAKGAQSATRTATAPANTTQNSRHITKKSVRLPKQTASRTSITTRPESTSFIREAAGAGAVLREGSTINEAEQKSAVYSNG